MRPNGNRTSATATSAAAIPTDNVRGSGRADAANAAAPTTAYARASANSARSVPSVGRSTKAANGGPHAAPTVLASVSDAASRTSSLRSRRSASPSSVNSAPERYDTGSVITDANQTTRVHRPTWAPLVNTPKPPYDTTHARPAVNAIVAIDSAANDRRFSHAAALRAPSAMPASTTASITLMTSVVVSTNIERKRNQITSRASSVNPARKAHTTIDATTIGRDRFPVPTGRGRSSDRPAADTPVSMRRDNNSAIEPAIRSSAAAIHALPATPTRAMRTTSAISTPATAPSVLHPYNKPSAVPNETAGVRRTSAVRAAATRMGSVAPIALAGTRSSRNAVASGRSTRAIPDRMYVSARPATAVVASSAA